MKHVSSHPLLCLCLFLAGCLCFFTALKPAWLPDEDEGGPAGGGHVPGLAPPQRPAKPQGEKETTKAGEGAKDPATPAPEEEKVPAKEGVPAPGSR